MEQTDFAALLSRLRRIEELLQSPGAPGHVEKANAMALSIAREALSERISDLAIRVISEAAKLGTASPDRTNLNHVLWHLRIALQEAKTAARP